MRTGRACNSSGRGGPKLRPRRARRADRGSSGLSSSLHRVSPDGFAHRYLQAFYVLTMLTSVHQVCHRYIPMFVREKTEHEISHMCWPRASSRPRERNRDPSCRRPTEQPPPLRTRTVRNLALILPYSIRQDPAAFSWLQSLKKWMCYRLSLCWLCKLPQYSISQTLIRLPLTRETAEIQNPGCTLRNSVPVGLGWFQGVCVFKKHLAGCSILTRFRTTILHI